VVGYVRLKPVASHFLCRCTVVLSPTQESNFKFHEDDEPPNIRSHQRCLTISKPPPTPTMNVQRFLLANRRRQASGANRSISSVDSSLLAVDSVDGFDRNQGREAEAAYRRMEWEQQYREMDKPPALLARAYDDSDDDSDYESSISSAESSSSISSA
jgi:hypothetical protein